MGVSWEPEDDKKSEHEGWPVWAKLIALLPILAILYIVAQIVRAAVR